MTVASTTRKLSYAGNGASSLAVPFRVIAAADLKVWRVNNTTLAIDAPLVLGVDYSVELNPAGAVVDLVSPTASGYTYWIERITARTQPDDLYTSGAFDPSLVEQMVDRLECQLQEVDNDKLAAPDAMTPVGAPLVVGADGRAQVGSTTQTGDMALRPDLADGVTAGKGAALVQVDGTFTLRGWIANLLTSAGAALVGWIQAGASAVTQLVQDELRRTVRPEHFGAKGDGVTDDTAAIRAAFTAAGNGGRVTLKEGKNYLVSGSIKPTTALTELYGGGQLSSAARITMASGVNLPMFDIDATCKIKFNGVALVGSSTTGTPLTAQALIKCTTVNNIEVRNCFLSGGHDLISLNGVCFYTRIENVYFGDCTNSWIYGVCAVANGFDITMTQCSGNSSQAAPYGFYFDGLGSLIMSDSPFSPKHCTVAGMMVVSQASLAGPCFITNTVFELGNTGVPGIYFKGTSGAPCKWWHFANSYFYGDPSVRVDYAIKLHFTNCYFTGYTDGAAGRYGIQVFNVGTDINLVNCDFETSNVPITADPAVSSLSMSITNPRYNGAFPFVTFGGITTPANLTAFTCVGGNVGTNTSPIQLPSQLDRNAYINTLNYNFGPVRHQVYTGTFAATGVVNIAHSITNGQKRVLSAQAWTRGGSGQMTPLTVNYVDGSNVNINNATSGAVYRMVLAFMNGADSNWP